MKGKGEDASPAVDEGSSCGATSPSPSEEEPKHRDDPELFGDLSPDKEEENTSAVAAKSGGKFNITALAKSRSLTGRKSKASYLKVTTSGKWRSTRKKRSPSGSDVDDVSSEGSSSNSSSSNEDNA